VVAGDRLSALRGLPTVWWRSLGEQPFNLTTLIFF
jgi:hypothetical protein